jgi:hypothetical protein
VRRGKVQDSSSHGIRSQKDIKKKKRILYEISGEAQICTATSNNNNEKDGPVVDDGG